MACGALVVQLFFNVLRCNSITKFFNVLRYNYHKYSMFCNSSCFMQPNGPGRYVFDIGCLQSGDYILEEKQKENAEDDEEQIIHVPRWRGTEISASS
jgi:hypothetical protein